MDPEPSKQQDTPAKWKKSREITGVSAGSIINFKATVAQEKEAISSGRTTKIRRLEGQPDIVKNKGVNLRSQRDVEQSVQGEKTFEEVQARLTEKSLIYQKFVSGGAFNQESSSDKGEFLVDFEQKNWDAEDDPNNPDNPDFHHPDMEREAERIRWETMARETAEEEERDALRRQEKRILLSQIIEETREGRDRVATLQEQRQRKVELRKQQIKKQAEIQKKRKEEQQTTQATQTPTENKKKLQLKKNTRAI